MSLYSFIYIYIYTCKKKCSVVTSLKAMRLVPALAAASVLIASLGLQSYYMR